MSTINKLEFKTGRLPLHFIILGYMLLAVGFWRIIANDWMGILYLIISVFLIFFKSGIIIDVDNKMLKKYVGIFIFRKGKWEDIKHLDSIQIVKTKESQRFNILSISRVETIDVYKLFLNLPDKKIELTTGNKDEIVGKAKKIASSLHSPVINNT
ncbi:MAG: hypothetical protein RQ761_07300 [Bacteroidales bacterium]|nr:hypothetical protein [Bacteroidales bacterium]